MQGCFWSGVVPGPLELLGHVRRTSLPVLGRSGASRTETSQVVELTCVGAEIVLFKPQRTRSEQAQA